MCMLVQNRTLAALLYKRASKPWAYGYLYVGDERTSGPFLWNFLENPQYFNLDFLL